MVLTLSVQAADVSITMDDFNIRESAMLVPRERNERILGALKKHRAEAALFVRGEYVQDNSGRILLERWSAEGHLIGNHTYSHRPFNARMSVRAEEEEILKCEKLLSPVPGFEKWFRFPQLAEGDTGAKRDELRRWLRAQDYQVGSVTIDASDWYIDQRMREKLVREPSFDLTKYRDYYLAHIWDRANYYNELSKRVLGREVKHTLLVHFNLLNALFLDDLLSMFERKSWRVISARDAFRDPVFSRLPDSMPSGQSLIWALAKESGKFAAELRYPGEDSVYEEPEMVRLDL